MEKGVVEIEKGPQSKGPYAPAVTYNNLVFISGQGPVDLETGEVTTGTFEEQTRKALDNTALVLRESGSGLDCVLKTTVYLADLDNFSAMNKLYEEYFGPSATARTTFQVARLPFDIAFEIDVVAHLREGKSSLD